MRRDSRFRAQRGDQADVLVNFLDDEVNLYQIRQWYRPLEIIARDVSVVVLCSRPGTARIISEECSLKVVLLPSFMDLREVSEVLNPKVVLYPNQNYNNYAILALSTAQHVFICHGESDKAYMSSNWMKVFNYFFVAGDASRDRLAKSLVNYDVHARTIPIGRPQIDMPRPQPPGVSSTRTTVLYAPTWEGGRPSMHYGSVASHGEAIVRGLLSEHRFRVIYRPHPRTGVQDPLAACANKRIKDLLDEAQTKDPTANHLIDDSGFGWQLDLADVMITDISAVAYDWLTTGKPMIITQPADDQAEMVSTGFMDDMPKLAVNDGARAAEVVTQVMNDADHSSCLERWSRYYYGDRSPGSSMERFSQAIHQVIDERDSWNLVDSLHPERLGVNAPKWMTGARILAGGMKRRMTRGRAEAEASKSVSALGRSHGADIVICSMAKRGDVRKLLHWLPAIEMLARRYRVAFIVQDYSALRLLAQRTRLPVFLGEGNGGTEHITKSLAPFAVLYFEQAKHNLRETAYQRMRHVYVGTSDGTQWINNRLRGFDFVLAHGDSQVGTIETRVHDFPPTSRVIDLGPVTSVGLLQAVGEIERYIDRRGP